MYIYIYLYLYLYTKNATVKFWKAFDEDLVSPLVH